MRRRMRPRAMHAVAVACAAALLVAACDDADTDDTGTDRAGPEPRIDNVWLEDLRVANIAHAGGIHEAPQNTLYAFATAADRGADVLEMDLHVTADGEVVVIHDSTVDRTTDGTGCVVEHTLEEIQGLDAAYHHVPGQGPEEGLAGDAYPLRGVATGAGTAPEGYEPSDFTVPTLEEVFDAVPETMPMVLELKPTEVNERGGLEHDCPGVVEAMEPEERPDLVAEVARIVDEHDRAGPVIVASFIDEMLREFVDIAPGVDTSFPLEEGLGLFAAYLDEREPENPFGHKALQAPIDIALELEPAVAEEFVAWTRSHGIAVHFWTVNDEADMETLLAWGADGIITDRVAALEGVLTDRGDPRPTESPS